MATILIVDDDELVREMMIEMISGDGHRTIAAGNGREALRAIAHQPPDLVITDILMPEKDGIELIMAINGQPNAPPIIAISGGRRSISLEFNLESAQLMGARATLAKPFTREQLRAAIASALSA